MPTEDDDLEEEGQPQLYDPPPGQNLETDQTPPVVPRDRPQGVNAFGTTAAEERRNEPLADRVRREQPDFGEPGARVGDDGEGVAARLLDPDSDIDEVDVTAEAIGLESEDDSAGLTAEEAAVHYVDEDTAGTASRAEEAADYLER